MTRCRARLFVFALAALAVGCADQRKDAIMRGTADWVIISYAGDIAPTLPLARQHCAQYEREPMLHETKEDNVIYFCLKPGEGPPPPVSSHS